MLYKEEEDHFTPFLVFIVFKKGAFICVCEGGKNDKNERVA
tara:strand:+ start:257 stop:379 length:123 start_codon:yes stop_codon:yes gene_type:complete